MLKTMHSTHHIMGYMGEPRSTDRSEYRIMGEDLIAAEVFTVAAAIMSSTLRRIDIPD